MSSKIDYTSGIGDNNDLILTGLHHYTVEDLALIPTGIVGDVSFDPDSLSRSSLDTWLPEIQHGYLYDKDKELYYYSDKRTEVWSIENIVNSSGFSYVNTSGNWIINPGVDTNGYYNPRDFNPSGYFSFVLTHSPYQESPIILYKLPYNITGNYIDDSIGSGYFSDYVTGSGYGSGYTALSSEFIKYGEYTKYTITTDISDDSFVPRYAKQTQFAITGFEENPSGFISPSGYYYSETMSGYVQVLPVICLDEQYDFPDDYQYAEFIPSGNRIFVPGEPCNIMLQYEGAENPVSVVSDIDINPLLGYSENSILAIANLDDDDAYSLSTVLSETELVGNNINNVIIHQSVMNANATPSSGCPIIMQVDRNYSYFDGSEFVDIEAGSEYELYQGSGTYTRATFSSLADGLIVYDQDFLALFRTNQYTDTYSFQSHGYFLCSGYREVDDVTYPCIQKTLDGFEKINDLVNINTASGYFISSSGVVYTDHHGSATGLYITPLNLRRPFDVTIGSYASGCSPTYKDISVLPFSELEYTFVDDSFVPDIREVRQYHVFSSGIISDYISGKGLVLSSIPFGGPENIIVYDASDFVAYELSGHSSTITPAYAVSELIVDDNYVYANIENDPSVDLIVTYETLYREAFEMNRKGVL